MMTFLRVLGSFVIVGILLWSFSRASAGRLGKLVGGSAKGRSTDPLTIVDRRQLTRSTGLAVVRAGSRHLLIGISDTGVQLLAEGDDLMPEVADAVEPDPIGSDAPHRSGASQKQLLSSTDQQSAGTRIWRANGPKPARMNFLAALREMTVRRS